MPKQIAFHELKSLAIVESPNEIVLSTQNKTVLSIDTNDKRKTVISLPYGNKFDIVAGNIIIHDK